MITIFVLELLFIKATEQFGLDCTGVKNYITPIPLKKDRRSEEQIMKPIF